MKYVVEDILVEDSPGEDHSILEEAHSNRLVVGDLQGL